MASDDRPSLTFLLFKIDLECTSSYSSTSLLELSRCLCAMLHRWLSAATPGCGCCRPGLVATEVPVATVIPVATAFGIAFLSHPVNGSRLLSAFWSSDACQSGRLTCRGVAPPRVVASACVDSAGSVRVVFGLTRVVVKAFLCFRCFVVLYALLPHTLILTAANLSCCSAERKATLYPPTVPELLEAAMKMNSESFWRVVGRNGTEALKKFCGNREFFSKSHREETGIDRFWPKARLASISTDVDVVSASTIWTPTLTPASSDVDANFSDLHALQSPEFREQASSPIGELSPMFWPKARLASISTDVDVVSASTIWTPTLTPASSDVDANFSDLHALQSPEFREQASSPIGELSPTELGVNALDAEIPGMRPVILPSTPGTARDRRQVRLDRTVNCSALLYD
ncbi:hypothetical protein Taro_012854 [Colocasia esculenta]|uniref:Uncharacterized protein n=1 Tax=Colocasia esculenta TaxID=4460 RepID=A0A843UAC5_COLES|nr:hypothetical protein [Colocasia esculenta]